MNNVSARQKAEDHLRSHLGELARRSQVHQESFSQLNTGSYQPSSILFSVNQRCQSIEKAPWALVATKELIAMTTAIDGLLRTISNLGNTLNSDAVSRKGVNDHRIIGDLDRTKDEHLQAFDDAYHNFESSTRHLDRPQDEVLKSMHDSRNRVLLLERKIEAQKAAADDIVTGMRDLSRGVSLSSYAKDFKDQASDLEAEAGWWLFGAGSLALLTLGAAITFVCLLYKDHAANLPADPTSRIILFASKLAILGFLASAATYAARMSKSIKHNALSFSLRGRALETMHLIIQNAEDPHTKAGIIQQVTMCIFSHQPTGLIGSETDTSMTPQMIELIRSVSSPPGKA